MNLSYYLDPIFQFELIALKPSLTISQVRDDVALKIFIVESTIWTWTELWNYSADWFNNSKINCAGLMLKQQIKL